ncbi:MAG: hypothetical protein LBL26_10515, partial [Peptococcaceae bacterium]|nr:hypothetical protein [Peptococcaceae bacterium]
MNTFVTGLDAAGLNTCIAEPREEDVYAAELRAAAAGSDRENVRYAGPDAAGLGSAEAAAARLETELNVPVTEWCYAGMNTRAARPMETEAGSNAAGPVEDRAGPDIAGLSKKAGNTADPGSLRLSTSAVKGRAAGWSAESANAAEPGSVNLGAVVIKGHAAGLNDAVSGDGLNPSVTECRAAGLNADVRPNAAGWSEKAGDAADPDNRGMNAAAVKSRAAAGLNATAAKGHAAGWSEETAKAAGLRTAVLRDARLKTFAGAGLNRGVRPVKGCAGLNGKIGNAAGSDADRLNADVRPDAAGWSEKTGNAADPGNRGMSAAVVKCRGAGLSTKAGNAADPGSVKLSAAMVKGHAAGLSAESANAAGLCIAKLRVAGLNDAARGARLNMIAAEPASEALDPSMTEERGPRPNTGVNPVKDRAAAGWSEKAGKAGNTADPGSLRLNTSAVKGRAAGLSAESANAAGLCIAGLRAAGLNDAVSGVGLSMTEA